MKLSFALLSFSLCLIGGIQTQKSLEYMVKGCLEGLGVSNDEANKMINCGEFPFTLPKHLSNFVGRLREAENRGFSDNVNEIIIALMSLVHHLNNYLDSIESCLLEDSYFVKTLRQVEEYTEGDWVDIVVPLVEDAQKIESLLKEIEDVIHKIGQIGGKPTMEDYEQYGELLGKLTGHFIFQKSKESQGIRENEL